MMIKALIVDDEYETRDGLKSLIPWNELGVSSIDTAIDGEEAMMLAESIKPDIIISDIRMPRMNGIAFVERIKSILPKSVIIFISGYSDKEYLKSAIKFKAIRYIEKPLDPAEIASAVQEAVETLRSGVRLNVFFLREIALKLLDPCVNALKTLQELKDAYPDFMASNRYCSLLLKISVPEQPSVGQSVSEDETEEIEAALSEAFDTCIVARLEGAGHYVAHFGIHETCDTEQLHGSVQKAMERLSAALGGKARIFAAAGKCVPKVELIWQSYQTAAEAFKSFFFNGYGAAVYWTQDRLPGYILDTDQIIRFETFLKKTDREGATKLLAALATHIQRNQSITEDNVREMYYNLLMRIVEVSQDRGLELHMNGDSRQDYLWKTIAGMETFSEIHTFLFIRTEDFFNRIDFALKNKPVYLIKLYIEKNYSDKSLSLKRIAESMHLTTAHICHIFKKETGMTIMQYLINYRVEKAQPLLKSKQTKLIEIADHVGFDDANYFSRTFKRVTGITPSQYREKYLL